MTNRQQRSGLTVLARDATFDGDDTRYTSRDSHSLCLRTVLSLRECGIAAAISRGAVCVGKGGHNQGGVTMFTPVEEDGGEQDGSDQEAEQGGDDDAGGVDAVTLLGVGG